MGLALAILILIIAQKSYNPVLKKIGTLQDTGMNASSFIPALLSSYFIIPIVIVTYHTIAWSYLLQKLSLSILYPISNGYLALLPFTSAYMLATPIKLQPISGAGLIVILAIVTKDEKITAVETNE